jgi:hypothetical protein
MKQFTLFKSAKDNYSMIIDVFKMLVGNFVKVIELECGLIIYHQEFNYEEIKSTIECGFGSFGYGLRGLQNRGAYAANYQG